MATTAAGIPTIELIHTSQAKATTQLKQLEGQHWIELSFQLNPNGLVVIKPNYSDLFYQFKTDLAANHIHVGYTGKKPAASQFTYNTSDNHSAAWARVDSDRFTDVYLSTGGLRGRFKAFAAQQIVPEGMSSFNPKTRQYQNSKPQLTVKQEVGRG